MSLRRLSPLDGLLLQVDRALRTLAVDAPAHGRCSPAKEATEQDLSDEEKRHAAGLMRVNHTGEVCAQALYQGQALTAKLTSVRGEMEQAADEEIDHLAWCQERVKQLGSHSSVLNPIWYGLSFGLGATAGLISDKLSLGFVSATEDQVCQHLEHHLKELPPKDEKSRAIVKQMLIDEAKHAHSALNAGGLKFPAPVKGLMALLSKAMTETSYRI
ncbi:MAG TPA: 2-polyprenyl-3-methyl-6-methoxy-1,4-benzoquinone monooxygenase [Porticoccus sp.]|nr:2-polyprenyl-3-methyl-6-methoxy-1,4-benzoquinone monooxygenase [Porticoccus sp.]